MIRAIYMDGKTAARRPVTVAASRTSGGENLIAISGEGVEAVWPSWKTRVVARPSAGGVQLGLSEGDERLSLTAADAAALDALIPGLLAKKGSRTAALGVGALAATALALFAAVFWLAPMAAGPIARATPISTERALGESAVRLVDLTTAPCMLPPAAQAETFALAQRLASAAQSPFPVDLVFLDADFPNAFAMPGGRIAVTDDLIGILETPEQLAGVLAHETAHVARRHVMAAIVRQIGGAVILDLVLGGGSGAGQQIAAAGMRFQALHHDRSTEAEADALAAVYLAQAGLDPAGLAGFFDVIGRELPDAAAMPELFQTHPLPARRAGTARELAATLPSPPEGWSPALSAEAWGELKAFCSDAAEGDPGGGTD